MKHRYCNYLIAVTSSPCKSCPHSDDYAGKANINLQLFLKNLLLQTCYSSQESFNILQLVVCILAAFGGDNLSFKKNFKEIIICNF